MARCGEPDEIISTLNYTNETGKRGVTHQDTSQVTPDELDNESGVGVRHTLLNGRKHMARCTMAKAGFELVKQKTELKEAQFENDALVKKIYYPELEALICGVTGASECRAFHHQLRIADPKYRDKLGKGKSQAPAGVVHADYSCRSSVGMFDGMCPQSMKNKGGRFIVCNAWRNVSDSHPIVNDHLAMCDATSVVAPDDFVQWDVVQLDGKTNESYRLDPGHSSRHKWYYYPNMMKDEVLLFMQYDSNPDTKVRYCFHTSCSDPTAPKDPGFSRMSLELRCIAFFPDYPVNTIPENRISGDVSIRRAVQAIRGAIEHGASWDDNGREWMSRELYKPGGVQSTAKQHVENHKPTRGKPLSEEDKAKVLAALLEGGYEERAKMVFPELKVSQEDWGVKLIPPGILEHSKNWDDNGKRWASSMVNAEGGGPKAVRSWLKALIANAAKEGHYELKGISEPVQARILDRLMANKELVDGTIRLFPPPKDPGLVYAQSITTCIKDVKTWGGGYTWAVGCNKRGAYREMAEGLVTSATKEGHHGMKGASAAVQKSTIDHLMSTKDFENQVKKYAV